MSNCPGPERGVFYIYIVNLISISALILFSLLSARNYRYNKVNLKVDIFKCKTIHSILLHIAVLHSILLRRFIKIVLICIILRYTWRGKFAAIVHWPTIILLSLSFPILNLHRTLLFSKISNLLFCGIYEHKLFTAVKVIHKLWFLSTTSVETKFLLPKPSDHWNTEHFGGSVNCGEVDLDSEINFLASGNIWNYTNVPSQCDNFIWSWTQSLLYFNHWCHFKKRPGIL